MSYGAAVSQKGYDVKTCEDRFLIYNSSFQTLKIFSSSSVSTTVPAAGTNTATVTHNLGYYAPFVVVYNDSSNDAAYFMSDSSGYSIHDNVEQSTTTLTINVENAFDGKADDTTVYFTVYIFIDTFDTIAENIINSDTTNDASSTDYGIRISKDGFDVKDCDDKDCVMSSSLFTDIVNIKGSDTSTSALVPLTVSHNLGYAPNALVYGRSSGGSYIRMCEGMPAYLDIFTGGRAGWFYYTSDSEIGMGENYLNAPDSDWRTGNTFYYIIFKNRSDG